MNLKHAKILLVGDYPTPVYTGLLGSYKRAFDYFNVNNQVFYFNLNNKFIRIFKYSDILLQLYSKNYQNELIEFILKSNSTHIIVFKGSYLLPDTINFIKSKGIIVCNINPDNPFNTNRISSNCLIKKSIPNYDYYFIWSNELKYKLSETYPNTKFIYLPFAVDDFIIPVFNNNFNYCYNLSFIGNSDKERFFKLNILLNSHQLIRENLMVFGNGWDSLNFKSIKGQVNGNDYFITFNKTKININILRDQNRDAHNMRTFEIPASCAFMLHEYSKDAIDLFKPGEEAEYYQSVEEFLDKFKFYLNNDSIREKIALSAYNKSRTFEYSYKQRAQLILNEITK